jgi:hypothetical protein
MRPASTQTPQASSTQPTQTAEQNHAQTIDSPARTREVSRPNCIAAIVERSFAKGRNRRMPLHFRKTASLNDRSLLFCTLPRFEFLCEVGPCAGFPAAKP